MSIRSHDAVIRVYDEAGNVIETHEAISKEDEFIPDSAREKCNHEQDCDPYARDTDDDFVARCHCHFQLSFNFAQRITLAAAAPLINGSANSSIAIENVRVPSRSRRRLRGSERSSSLLLGVARQRNNARNSISDAMKRCGKIRIFKCGLRKILHQPTLGNGVFVCLMV
jgi:hypothetical protein